MWQCYDNCFYGMFCMEVLKWVFKKYFYQWLMIGFMDYLNVVMEVDYVNFYKDFYVFNNVVLVIVGDFEIKQVKKWVN